MVNRRVKKEPVDFKSKPQQVDVTKAFHVNYKNSAQEMAWDSYQKHDILFLIGPAGTAKTFLATAFGTHDVLTKARKNLIITRPAVSDEDLGFLPGDMLEKIAPYMRPIYDSIKIICGASTRDREIINASMEVCPLQYIQGRTFNDSVFILDEAQNCTYGQIKLAISRLGINSKMIITGDPDQSFLPGPVALDNVVSKICSIPGIGVMRFTERHVVRHSLVGKILKVL